MTTKRKANRILAILSLLFLILLVFDVALWILGIWDFVTAWLAVLLGILTGYFLGKWNS